MTSTLPTLRLDEELARDGDRMLREVRARGPIALSDRGFEVLTYGLCRTLTPDRRFLKGHDRLVDALGLPPGPALDYHRRMIQSREGDDHRRLRGSVTPSFNRPGAEQMRASVRRIVNQVLDELEELEDIDLFAAVCLKIPAEVYCSWVDAPRSDVPFVIAIAERINLIFVHQHGHADAITGVYDELFPYMDELIARRRASPGDDILSRLLATEAEGKLDRLEVRDQATMLLEGSTDNSSQQIALTVAAMLEHPGELEKLRRDPSLIPAAVEEGLRYASRVLTYDRFAREDVVVEGVEIPAGATVVINVRSAHRDETVFTEPERFSVTRTGEPGPLTFGGGAHACVGLNIARIEVQETLRALVERFPASRLVGDVERYADLTFQGVRRLPVTLAA